jgi:hypothetical protein
MCFVLLFGFGRFLTACFGVAAVFFLHMLLHRYACVDVAAGGMPQELSESNEMKRCVPDAVYGRTHSAFGR